MSAYLKNWGLAVELKSNPDGLNRIGNLAFTRSEAESYRDKWNRLYPSNPVAVINLKTEHEFTRLNTEASRDKWCKIYPANPVAVINLKAE